MSECRRTSITHVAAATVEVMSMDDCQNIFCWVVVVSVVQA